MITVKNKTKKSKIYIPRNGEVTADYLTKGEFDIEIEAIEEQIQELENKVDNISGFTTDEYFNSSINEVNNRINEVSNILNEINYAPINITENGVYTPEDGVTAFNEVTVNIEGTGKISLQDYGFKLGNSPFTTVPKFFSFEGLTDFGGLFTNCNSLTELPQLEWENSNNFYNMLWGCNGLRKLNAPNPINIPNLTDIQYFVSEANLIDVPEFILPNVEIIANMFTRTRLNSLEIEAPKLRVSNLLLDYCNQDSSIGLSSSVRLYFPKAEELRETINGGFYRNIDITVGSRCKMDRLVSCVVTGEIRLDGFGDGDYSDEPCEIVDGIVLDDKFCYGIHIGGNWKNFRGRLLLGGYNHLRSVSGFYGFREDIHLSGSYGDDWGDGDYERLIDVFGSLGEALDRNRTIYLSSTVLNNLTDEAKMIAINKGFTLSD